MSKKMSPPHVRQQKPKQSNVDIGPYIQALISEHKYADAAEMLLKALKYNPKDPRTLELLALCQLKLGSYDKARELYKRAIEIEPENFILHEGMSETCGLSGRMQEAADHGTSCLAIKANSVAGSSIFPIPNRPPPALSNNRLANVIAFSLFGANPRYCETAILNVQQAAILFPFWTCRFYVDGTVPAAIISRLEKLGADMRHVPDSIVNDISPLMWRFLVASDGDVSRFLLRDADSILSVREKVAVDAWISSEKWFHAMRDFFTHHELLLAGMWGGCTGVFTDIATNMRDFCIKNSRSGVTVDQQFLRGNVWPTICQSLICHDSVFKFGDIKPFPAHEPVTEYPNFHVGCNIGVGQMSGTVVEGDARTLAEWSIVNESGQEICRYSTPIRNGKWESQVPLPYYKKLLSGDWKLNILA